MEEDGWLLLLHGLTSGTGLHHLLNVAVNLRPPDVAAGQHLHLRGSWVTLVQLCQHCFLETARYDDSAAPKYTAIVQ